MKNVKFINCAWRAEGKYKHKKGYIAEKMFPLYFKCEGEDSSKFYKVIGDYNWVDMKIFVKAL